MTDGQKQRVKLGVQPIANEELKDCILYYNGAAGPIFRSNCTIHPSCEWEFGKSLEDIADALREIYDSSPSGKAAVKRFLVRIDPHRKFSHGTD